MTLNIQQFLFISIYIISLLNYHSAALNVQRNLGPDIYEGLTCNGQNSFENINGSCKCNYDKLIFISIQNESPQCYNEKAVQQMSGMYSFGSHANRIYQYESW